ncbi:hypothetical protein AVCANL279_06150 [Campylobacter canadensis]|uniref:hypothetical protein n=1 Tax=Campylobacter canadensis TaxID=449520 RepID=UPI0015550E66|nr:hypothetical protein [Campylobacter canadensis]MBZ7994950.1 hypothetical protein [Campylobacter canadensis]MBZ7996900.1 hypothetical protein [Campylobacter canadensis]MBZ8000379.1 hypothetical protein [Campylobacter canadensis]MBZ8002180.1 hypothetical protein [Campylobacter canadensis]MBZ8003109.1 hypothetical protein [Campylobacter canadensis]
MKDLLKELGKLSFDFAKVIFALAIITPVLKDESFNYWSITAVIICIAIGSICIYKGGKDGNA